MTIDAPAGHELAIKTVVKGAIENTSWMKVSSLQEMTNVLEVYYTGHLLREFSESAWNFTRGCTDWDFVVRAENCKILSNEEGIARVRVDILETEAISGVTYCSRAEYSLNKTENGWRIAEYKLLPEEKD